ncbi:MAG: hypothetical protein WC548_01325 [Candidatus Pacearchaeota archaeon]
MRDDESYTLAERLCLLSTYSGPTAKQMFEATLREYQTSIHPNEDKYVTGMIIQAKYLAEQNRNP